MGLLSEVKTLWGVASPNPLIKAYFVKKSKDADDALQ